MGTLQPAAKMNFLCSLTFTSLLHLAIAINFPGLRNPTNRPLRSTFPVEPCTDVLESGATRGSLVTLAAGEGRRFVSPGFDGVSAYSPESKCLWTFAPASGASLRFTCTKFSVTPMDPVGEKCRGESCQFVSKAQITLLFKVTFCGFTTCPLATPLMTPGSVIVTLQDQTSPTTPRSRFCSGATQTLW